jgi:hypothetical protein
MTHVETPPLYAILGIKDSSQRRGRVRVHAVELMHLLSQS